MVSCYILDDELYAINALTDYVERIPELRLIGCNTDPIRALEEIHRGLKPNILFLDIQMSAMSGFQIAEILGKEIGIIFTTGHLKFALEGYEKNALDFLLKPIAFERFLSSFERAKSRLYEKNNSLKEEKQQLFVNSGKGNIISIILNDILHIAAMDHYVVIQTQNDRYIIHSTMKAIKVKLPQNFFRVHKSHIININKIKQISKSVIVLINGTNVPFGELHRDEFMSILNLL